MPPAGKPAGGRRAGICHCPIGIPSGAWLCHLRDIFRLLGLANAYCIAYCLLITTLRLSVSQSLRPFAFIRQTNFLPHNPTLGGQTKLTFLSHLNHHSSTVKYAPSSHFTWQALITHHSFTLCPMLFAPCPHFPLLPPKFIKILFLLRPSGRLFS